MAKYHLSDILSVTTGRMLSSNYVSGICGILNYMTGEKLFTHQLPRALKSCAPHILKQYPQLAQVNFDTELKNENDVHTWLQEQINEYGEYLEIAPLTAGDYQVQNPIDEMIDIADGKSSDNLVLMLFCALSLAKMEAEAKYYGTLKKEKYRQVKCSIIHNLHHKKILWCML